MIFNLERFEFTTFHIKLTKRAKYDGGSKTIQFVKKFGGDAHKFLLLNYGPKMALFKDTQQ